MKLENGWLQVRTGSNAAFKETFVACVLFVLYYQSNISDFFYSGYATEHNDCNTSSAGENHSFRLDGIEDLDTIF